MPENYYTNERENSQSIHDTTWRDSSSSTVENHEMPQNDFDYSRGKEKVSIPTRTEEEQLKLEEWQNSPEFQKGLKEILPKEDYSTPTNQQTIDILNFIHVWEEEHSLDEEESTEQNTTGLPDDLKSGLEALSGISLDDIKVYYNSPLPAKYGLAAFAEKNNIYIAPGQKKHLAHEAWHVIQQKQGRVKADTKMDDGLKFNKDQSLEEEATNKGNEALKNKGNGALETPLEEISIRDKVAQGMLHEYARSAGPMTQERLDFIKKNGENKVPDNELQDAFDDPDNSYYLDIVGSVNGTRGFGVRSIKQFIPTGSFNVKNRGGLSAEPDDSTLGWNFSGRPAWSDYIMKNVKTIKGQENIRHIIPYHMIRDSFVTYLNAQVQADQTANFSIVVQNLKNLAIKTNAGQSTQANAADFIIEQSMLILTKLNSAPGNLWAGSAEENQRLNTLRIRISNIVNAVQSLANPKEAGAKALEMLLASLNGAGSTIYKELIQGAINHLPKKGTADFENAGTVVSALKNAWDSCEFDAMPSIKELKRLNEEQLFLNFPELGKVIAGIRAGDFVTAASHLVSLPSPH